MSVFISYSRKDLAFMNEIREALQNRGLTVWVDERDILAASEFDQEILKGLEDSTWFLLVMSRQSATSEYVKDELYWALSNRPGRVLPVMVEDCDPLRFHLRLNRIQYVNFTQVNRTRHEELSRCLERLISPDSGVLQPLRNRGMQPDLELISLLLTFLPRFHQKHLRNLHCQPSDGPIVYKGCAMVRRELRELCEWGLLERQPSVKVAEVARDGNPFFLGRAFSLTTIGKLVAPKIT